MKKFDWIKEIKNDLERGIELGLQIAKTKVTELKAILKEYGVKGYSKLKKEGLIRIILNDDVLGIKNIQIEMDEIIENVKNVEVEVDEVEIKEVVFEVDENGNTIYEKDKLNILFSESREQFLKRFRETNKDDLVQIGGIY